MYINAFQKDLRVPQWGAALASDNVKRACLCLGHKSGVAMAHMVLRQPHPNLDFLEAVLLSFHSAEAVLFLERM